ncbi:MAG: 50S ribosomal protein L3 [Firmicutes bacterium]|nr:50S ribosomal protein L3 [Bacillota bacterium]
MEKAILGRKLGMSQIFTPTGTAIPVTVIEAGPCSIVQIKTLENDGYASVKVGFGDIKAHRLNKPEIGQFKKLGEKAPLKKHLKEFRFKDCAKFEVGGEIKCDSFVVGDKVDISGKSRGRGFTGTVQRWNTHCGPNAHGSGYHRGVGSLGANSSPSRVLKNKKMPGQYGSERVTVQNLEVVKIYPDKNLILVAGGIPGPRKGIVEVKSTVKKVKPGKWFKAPVMKATKK